MDYEKARRTAQIFTACSGMNGVRCSSCPAFGQGDRHCVINSMRDGATAITELLANDNQVKEALQLNGFETLDALLEAYNQVMAENAALRKMQPVHLDDTGAKAASLASEVSELRQKLAEAEARAEKAERERGAAIADLRFQSFCDNCKYNQEGTEKEPLQHCTLLTTCRDGDGWEWRGQKEE